MKHTTTRKKGFVLDLTTRVMHKLPTKEECKVDELLREDRVYFKTIWGMDNFKRCEYCFPGVKR